MTSKIRQLSKYAIYVLWSNVFYGLIVYHVFLWLARHSLLYAYFGNLAFILLGLGIDMFIFKTLQSTKFIADLRREKDMEKSYRFVQMLMDSFVSFKSALYLFYVFILVISKIVEFHPEFVGENIGNFIRANDYSILFLLAFDALFGQFSKDRKRMEEISDKLKASLAEDQE